MAFVLPDLVSQDPWPPLTGMQRDLKFRCDSTKDTFTHLAQTLSLSSVSLWLPTQGWPEPGPKPCTADVPPPGQV